MDEINHSLVFIGAQDRFHSNRFAAFETCDEVTFDSSCRLTEEPQTQVVFPAPFGPATIQSSGEERFMVV